MSNDVKTETVKQLKPKLEEGYLKLGDAFEVVAQPIAKGIDYIFGSNVQDCGGCGRRKEKLNRLVKKRKS